MNNENKFYRILKDAADYAGADNYILGTLFDLNVQDQAGSWIAAEWSSGTMNLETGLIEKTFLVHFYNNDKPWNETEDAMDGLSRSDIIASSNDMAVRFMEYLIAASNVFDFF